VYICMDYLYVFSIRKYLSIDLFKECSENMSNTLRTSRHIYSFMTSNPLWVSNMTTLIASCGKTCLSVSIKVFVPN
jgi:hypothetical protein